VYAISYSVLLLKVKLQIKLKDKIKANIIVIANVNQFKLT